MTHYDEAVAASYDADRAGEEHWGLENSFVAKCLIRYRGACVLDTPIGTGRFLDLYRQHGVRKVVGIDMSPHMLLEARKRVPQGLTVQLEEGDAFAIAYPDGAFDAAICFRLLHLIPPERRQLLLRELLRVSHELVLQAYVTQRQFVFQRAWTRLRSLGRPKPTKPWHSIPCFTLSAIELGTLIENAGAKVISKETLCSYENTLVEAFILRR